MKELSRIASAVQASTTMAIDAMFKQMKADGVDVIGFGAGEPDFNTPDNIKAAGIAAIEQNITRYTPAAGTVELRQAVCGRMKADYGLEYKPSQVVVSSGAKHLVYLALRAVVNPGDEVILPAPYWVSYIELIKMVGGVPVVVTATEAEHFKLTAEKLSAAITPRTKAILLNNPSQPNRHDVRPGGAGGHRRCVYPGGYLCDFRRDLRLPGLRRPHLHQLRLPQRRRQGAHHPGQRRIQGIRHDRLAHRLRLRQRRHRQGDGQLRQPLHRFSGGHLPEGRRCGPLRFPAEIATMRQAFEQRRNYIVERMNAIPGVSCIQPEGAFYVMMNLEQLLGKTIHGVAITNDDVFADAFLKYGLVAVVPGSGFGAPNFVRWSYATSMENIKEGLDRLEKFLAE